MNYVRNLPRIDKAMLLAVGLISLLFWGFILRLYYPHSLGIDYISHVRFAEAIASGEGVNFPHILYHMLIIGLGAVLPVDYSEASFIINLAFSAGTTILLYLMLRNAATQDYCWFPLLAGFMAVALFVVWPIRFDDIALNGAYMGYIPASVYHNPTITILKPLALGVFIYTAALFRGQLKLTPKMVIGGAVLVLACALAKPNYLISLFPATMVLWLYYRFIGHRPVSTALFVTTILLPTILILAVQYLFTFQNNEQTGILFSPFTWVQDNSFDLLIKWLASTLFPMMVYGFYFKSAKNSISFNLAWLTYIFGAIQLYLFVESGARMSHGNFQWSGQITVFVLFVAAAVFLMQQKVNTWRWWASLVIFVLHFLSGIPFILSVINALM